MSDNSNLDSNAVEPDIERLENVSGGKADKG